MSPTQVTPDGANSAGTAQLGSRPRVVAAANVNEVLLEQLEYLIEHAQGGICGCAHCQRYLRARSVLLELFADSAAKSTSAN
jgi:hypothetical protein